MNIIETFQRNFPTKKQYLTIMENNAPASHATALSYVASYLKFLRPIADPEHPSESPNPDFESINTMMLPSSEEIAGGIPTRVPDYVIITGTLEDSTNTTPQRFTFTVELSKNNDQTTMQSEINTAFQQIVGTSLNVNSNNVFFDSILIRIP